uniref:NADH-ubiquinone oxidoreductase chain 4 n=1 Tax=Nomia chalybeata TaxID=2448184 RepID=A0A7L8EYN0_9HYME|nr:NADH dehydrogenase subunit 4 [Nomia chalybeata]QOE17507.1 NADH dehydrogenase subunit 4 [Nomia chalybeata]
MVVSFFIMFLIMLLMNNFQLSIILLLSCSFQVLGFNMFVNNNFVNDSVSMNLYSYLLLSLSLLIMGLIFMFFNVPKKEYLYYKFLMFLMLLSLSMVFIVTNLMMFYFMFEMSLLTMFLIILKWGLGEMRKLASFYLLYYTMFFSLPFMIFIIDLNKNYFVSEMYIIELLMMIYLDTYMFVFFMMTFFVKIPMYMLHFWLLKAHVEAPVIGSMILAGILLKLGVYGLVRFMNMFIKNFIKFNFVFLYLSIFGSLLISILCIRQVDMKILVAYSSVVHMGLMLSSMMTLTNISISGSYMMMIAHGLCSSGLFFLVNLCYLMSNSRLMIMNKGLMNIYPSMSLLWFLLCSSNFSAPMSLNLVSEIMLITSLLNWNFMNLFILMFLMFFSFLYSLNLFSYTQHGEFNIFQNLKNFNFLDYLILLVHWIPLNLFILNLSMF